VCDTDTRYQGLLGLDAVRAMKVVIDLVNDRLLIGNGSYQLADCTEERHSVRNACIETQVEQEHRTDHPVGPTYDITRESTAGINPNDGEANTSRVPSSPDGRNVEQSNNSRGSTEEVWGVMSFNTTVPARSTVVARLNLVSEDRTRIQVGQIGPWVLVEGAGATIPGISAGRALSGVYDSGELGDPKGDLNPRLDNVSGSGEQSKHTVPPPPVRGTVLYSDLGLRGPVAVVKTAVA
jgi:hypothetical protein